MSLSAQECRANAIEHDERANMATRYEDRMQHEEIAKQLRAMADQLELHQSPSHGRTFADPLYGLSFVVPHRIGKAAP
jgi:hypothetical protein